MNSGALPDAVPPRGDGRCFLGLSLRGETRELKIKGPSETGRLDDRRGKGRARALWRFNPASPYWEERGDGSVIGEKMRRERKQGR